LLDNWKGKVADTLSRAKEGTVDMTVSMKDSIEGSAKKTKESIDDFSLTGKVKDFSFNAVNLVSDIDTHLLEKNSRYEVASFRVSGNLSLMGGMTLDIQFTKTAGEKEVSKERSSYLSVTNPSTGKSIKIPKSQIGTKKQVKVKDSETGEVLLVDIASGKVIQQT